MNDAEGDGFHIAQIGPNSDRFARRVQANAPLQNTQWSWSAPIVLTGHASAKFSNRQFRRLIGLLKTINFYFGLSPRRRIVTAFQTIALLLQRGRAMLRACQQLASTVRAIPRAQSFTISYFGFSFITAYKLNAVLFSSRNVEASCHRYFLVVSRETTPLMIIFIHQHKRQQENKQHKRIK